MKQPSHSLDSFRTVRGGTALLALFMLMSVCLGACTRLRGLEDRTDRIDAGVASPGLVVSTSSVASDVGAAVLSRGGNAVDAAIATAFALAVTHPQAGNLGGGGFMVIQPPNGEAIAIDYRERAPLASTPDLFLDDEGKIDTSKIRTGVLAVGVPGTVRGLAFAHERFGTLPWKSLVLPAAELAREGFVVRADLAESLNEVLDGPMGGFPSSVQAYGKPGGGAWKPGDRIVLSDLARTLEAIAEGGEEAFYEGWIGEKLVEFIRSNGGILSLEDLKRYRPAEREPVRGTFRGYEILSMPPPSSGGVALIQMLNILETFEMPEPKRFQAETVHLLAESMRRAFLDRARHLGDPDFVSVPVEKLTSKEYARRLAEGISSNRTTSSAKLGADILTVPRERESEQTTHFSVYDGRGMAVANTYTLESSYGCKVVAQGVGFLLNNEMGDFNRKPGHTDTHGNIGTDANLIVPEKRMLSSMTPTLVRKDGRVVLITGSPGGRTIINTVLQVVLNVTGFGFDDRSAVDAPRVHHQWMPDRLVLEEDRFSPEVVKSLEAMGHEIATRERQGDAHTIFIDPETGQPSGWEDRRRSRDAKSASAPVR